MFLLTRNAEKRTTRAKPKVKKTALPALILNINYKLIFEISKLLPSFPDQYLYRLIEKNSVIKSRIILSHTSEVDDGLTLKQPHEISKPLINACERAITKKNKKIFYR